MADPEKQETAANPDPAPTQQTSGGGGDIGMNMPYITSISGILKIVEFFLLMIAFSLGADSKGGAFWSWPRMDFFLFVTVTSWLVVIFIFVVFAFNLHSRVTVSFDWNLPVIVFAVVAALLLLISSSLIADQARGYSSIYAFISKLKSAAAFGFISMFVFIGDAVFHYLKIQGKV